MAADHSRLLRWYPRAWRDRYGDDLIAYMHDRFGDDRLPIRAQWSLVRGGVEERVRLSGLRGDSASPEDRVRAGALVVLCSWTAFVIAGANLAKLSEHFDQALPHDFGAHRLPDVAYSIIQGGAGVGGLAVIAGAILALPAVIGFLASSGWSTVKRWAVPAVACTAVAFALFVALRSWAHHLSDAQRNGGSIAYEALFLAWGAAAAIALILWTATAVAAARRTQISRRLLRAEAALGLVVTAAMVVMLVATALWWAVVASRAPLFLNSDPSIPANGRLIASVVVMCLSANSAAAGIARVARSWRLVPRG